MKTEVSILHHEYPNRIRDHVARKLQDLVRFYEGTVSVRAVLERQRGQHRVELVSNVRRGVVLVVDARGGTVASALDDAVGKMRRALSRYKDKLRGAPRRRDRS